MAYPTLEEVDAADHEQICRWYRFLPSPGAGAVGEISFQEALTREAAIMNRIAERLLKEFGGFTSEISKKIGWGKL